MSKLGGLNVWLGQPNQGTGLCSVEARRKYVRLSVSRTTCFLARYASASAISNDPRAPRGKFTAMMRTKSLWEISSAPGRVG
eukprot:4731360-Pyramimonas_sp.AAC.1